LQAGNGVERVRGFVAERGLDVKIVELDGSTRSSALAAQALGCTVAEIAKSVVFSGEVTVVVVLSGDRRVDVGKLRGVGGVPPFPHNDGIAVVADASLGRFEKVWAASGAQNAVMQIATGELLRTIGGGLVDVAQA
jgi:prolyl-tRNA editing enzyme YbaK/EbsC (Cys-tRNA(Pro) deacylase)